MPQHVKTGTLPCAAVLLKNYKVMVLYVYYSEEVFTAYTSWRNMRAVCVVCFYTGCAQNSTDVPAYWMWRRTENGGEHVKSQCKYIYIYIYWQVYFGSWLVRFVKWPVCLTLWWWGFIWPMNPVADFIARLFKFCVNIIKK